LVSGTKGGTYRLRVLRRIFEPKRDEVREVGENSITGSFINNLYFSPSISQGG
jgi:hypothetical protein